MIKSGVVFPGARFYKVDLHLHTSASKCWNGKRDVESLRQIFKHLKENCIEVVAITDHNSVDNVDRAKKLGKKLSIQVYPGVEVSTKEGHVLALFDPKKHTRQIEDWLTRMGFTSDLRGNVKALAQDQDGEPLSITKVFDFIENEDGVAIAPHPNSKGTGFLEILKQKGAARQQAYHSPNLRGLEVGKDREKVLKIASGCVPGYKKKYACVASSDSHSVKDIGRAFTYIKLGDFGIGALKQALYDPAMRIRFADQWPPNPHSCIESIEVNQSFFKDMHFLLHPDMNTLVGGKATGKSLLIELMRFALGSKSPIREINDETESKVNSPTCLGEGGTVTLHVMSEQGERYRIQRTLSDLDEGPEVYYADTQTKAADRVTDVFGCTIYSQNEIIELGRKLPALLEWLDGFIDMSKEREEAAKLKKQIQSLLNELDSANTIAIKEKELTKRLTELQDKKKLLNEKIKDPILKEFQKWQKEERLLESSQDGIYSLQEEVKKFFEDIDVEGRFEEADTDTPNAKKISLQRKSLLRLRQKFDDAKAKLESALKSTSKGLKDYVKSWQSEFQTAKDKHQEVIRSAGVANASALTSELNKVIAQIEQIKKYLKKAKDAAAEKANIENKLWKTLIPNYNKCFVEIFKKRLDKSDKLTKDLDGFVRISVRQMVDRTDFSEAVTSLARGSSLRRPELQEIVAAMTPLELTKYIVAKNAKGLAQYAEIKEDKALTLIEHVWAKTTDDEGNQRLSSLYSIIFTDLKDQVIVELKVQDEMYKPMEELSVGSKCTAILSIALVEGRCPLIVDQPEDALDNPFVFEQIVKTVRQSKEGRQYIFATHNSNVAVASDADLIYCLKATASHGGIDKRGSIDQISTRDRVVANLEGGRNAFALRSQKYDIVFDDPHAVVLDIS